LGARDDSAVVIWEPQAGPQWALLRCPVFEVFFGGARGGGKTDGMLGDFASHAAIYGKDAIGLMVRRERTQLIETIERSRQLYAPLGAKFNEQDKLWRFPNGARLRFAYLERDADADAYQGHSYCVAVGTRIRMADGSLRAIEAIEPGEMVATLEGPRRVLASTQPYVAPCVEAVVRDSSGSEIGRQRHPIWHPILTTAGLTSSPSARLSESDAQPQSGQSSGDRQDRESQSCGRQETLAWRAYSEDVRSGYTEWRRTPEDAARPGSLCVPVALHALAAQSAGERTRAVRREPTLSRACGRWSGWWSGLCRGYQALWSDLRLLAERAQSILDRCFLGFPSALAGVPSGWREAPDSRFDCPSDRGSCDGRAHTAPRSGLSEIPSQGDAGNTPLAWLWGGLGTTPLRTRLASTHWVHPYTGEARSLSEEVTAGTMELRFCGDALVADLTVEDANHYISECGLINKNTRVYVEEIGTFPSPAPIMKLMATLRSGAGVPCGFRATGNPGGPGQHWVKARYIDHAPKGMTVTKHEFRSPFDGKVITRDRVYIPSRVTDNKFLGAEYVANLQMSGSPELVRAWLEGDWNVIAGAFFPEFSMARHVCAPRELPAHWARFVAADWGSAKPFSVGWYAVSDGELSDIPRGCLVKYREWYGMAGEPDVGIKLHAEEWGAGIKARTQEKIAYYVVDPAAMHQNGGPSIAERTGIDWFAADNKRVGTVGAMGGWDQLRARLKGDGEHPGILFFSTCVHTIRTIPALQHDENRPEDVDTEAEDHAGDETRYACMSRPYVLDNPKPQPVRFPVHRTINEMIEAKRRARDD
jgi:hypothetical protein